MAVKKQEELKIPLSAVPESLRTRLGAEAPRGVRLALAKAALPVPPSELLPVLAYLSQQDDEEIATEARKSAGDIPEGFVKSLLQERSTPSLSSRLFRTPVCPR